jgi:hypothetical protein
MLKKGVRVVITGQPRPAIDVEAMTQIIIALGREFATGKNVGHGSKPVGSKVVSS